FSPDGTKFYRSSPTSIYQWDLCAGSSQAIIASQYTVASGLVHGIHVGGMQLAKNGKIYITSNNSSSLHVINNPNTQGGGCNFVSFGQSVAPRVLHHGLHNLVSGFLIEPPPAPPFNHTVSNTFGCYTASFTAPPIVANYTALSCSSAFSLVSHH